jgi:hypothetical protein
MRKDEVPGGGGGQSQLETDYSVAGWGQPGRPPARGTEDGMEPDDLLCSRNARPPKALVGRAHLRIDQATLEEIRRD